MATLPGLDLAQGVAGLSSLASSDLASLWRQVRNAAEAETALRDILPALIDIYGAAAATLAADWYDDTRAKVGPPKQFTAIPADIKDAGAHALIGWAVTEASDIGSMQTLIEGGTQRRIANFSRSTIAGSSIADPGAAGWKRIGGGSSCTFCQMLIARDQLYSEASADFASHDHCNCSAYPLIKGAEPIKVKDYIQSSRTSRKPGESDAAYEKRRTAGRTRVREYLATH